MAANGPAKPPQNIEDFLWSLHTVLVTVPGPLVLDQLKEAYAKQLGHKCAIERWLVVGDGGLAATLRRIPHIVTLFQASGTTCVRSALAQNSTKEQLIEKDKQYRADIKRKQLAKAGGAPAAAGAKAPAAAQAAPAGTAPPKRPAAAPEAAKAPAPKAAKNGGDAQPAARPKAEEGAANPDTLARMLIQGVMRVLQNRAKEGKGPLPISELEAEFKALWKVPFNLPQAGETDAVTFLTKYPNKVEVIETSPGVYSVQQSKASAQKGKDKNLAAPAKPAEPAAASPPTAAKAAGAKAPSESGSPKPAAAPPAAKAPEEPKAAQPTRPPATIEDFLWNLHIVLHSSDAPIPVDKMKEAYSNQLGHRCCIERFLVVGADGLGGTLKRIPHMVKVITNNDGSFIEPVQAKGITKEGLIAADQQFRSQLLQKQKQAKAATAAKAATPAATPAKPAAPAPAAGSAPDAAADEPKAAPAARPAPAAAEPEAKRARVEAAAPANQREDADTLQRMLVQGVIRVVQNRIKEGKGPQPIETLAEDFKALWKVPFNLQQAGETDTITFLRKYPNKLEVTKVGNQDVVSLARKDGAKAPAAAKAGAAVAAPAEPKAAAPAEPAPVAPKAAAPATAGAGISDAEHAKLKAAAVAALEEARTSAIATAHADLAKLKADVTDGIAKVFEAAAKAAETSINEKISAQIGGLEQQFK